MTRQKIFFSYSRADGSAFALKLAVDLKKKGFDVWIDQEDIRPGLDWDTEIEKALESCDYLLFVETEKSVVSNNVLDEVYYALDQNKKVIPLVYVDSKTPYRLNRLQHIDFTQSYDTGLARLVNALEGNPETAAYPREEKTPLTAYNKPVRTKNYRPVLIIACITVLIAAVIGLTIKNIRTPSTETKEAVASTDTLTGKTANLTALANPVDNVTEGGSGKSTETIIPVENNKRSDQRMAAPVGSAHMSSGLAKPTRATAGGNSGNLTETIAGDWRLLAVEPKARAQNGYLKIEALDENKATIKSYVQFYYPDSKASSYLTVFNAFVGCATCAVSKEMKLKVEDIAVGSRSIKKLQEDQDGKKAGDIILDASANKSIHGTATLQFVDNDNAVIEVRQLQTIALANGLMLEPFVYTFHFKRND